MITCAASVTGGLHKHVQYDIPWLLLFANDVALIDEKRARGTAKLDKC